MFTTIFQEFLETFVSAEIATTLASAFALLLVMLIFNFIIGLFLPNSTKRLFIICSIVIFIILSTFLIAKNYGFIKLPIVMEDIQ